ncbi:MAG: hypothetical protein RL220_1868 [Bacteroidota bacterium]
MRQHLIYYVMKQILTLATLLITLFSFSPAFAGDNTGDFNRIDESGRKQGYWVVKGYMSNDPSFKADAVVEEGSFKDDRKEGLWRKFWPNGNVRSEIMYEMGRPNGEYKIYYLNGKIEEHAYWVNSRNTGTFKRWYDNGNPQQEFYFDDNGRRNGWQKYYHENGITAVELQVVNGQESGVCKRYNTDGTLNQETTFNNGVVTNNAKVTPSSGKEEHIADSHNSDLGKSSEKTEDAPNAAHKFKPNGYNVLYDNDGNMTQSGAFKEGKLWDGKWYRYNGDGLLIRIEVYSEGRFIGSGVMSDDMK